MIRGAVYRIDLGRPRGHEQAGRRLALVVSPSDSPLSVVTVIPTSTSAGPSIHRPELEVEGRPTRLLVDQIRSVDTDDVVGDPVDYLNRAELVGVELALAALPRSPGRQPFAPLRPPDAEAPFGLRPRRR